jgi:hypothetical protein
MHAPLEQPSRLQTRSFRTESRPAKSSSVEPLVLAPFDWSEAFQMLKTIGGPNLGEFEPIEQVAAANGWSTTYALVRIQSGEPLFFGILRLSPACDRAVGHVALLLPFARYAPLPCARAVSVSAHPAGPVLTRNSIRTIRACTGVPSRSETGMRAQETRGTEGAVCVGGTAGLRAARRGADSDDQAARRS